MRLIRRILQHMYTNLLEAFITNHPLKQPLSNPISPLQNWHGVARCKSGGFRAELFTPVVVSNPSGAAATTSGLLFKAASKFRLAGGATREG